MPFDNIVKVFNKNRELLAVFTGDTEGISDESKADLMVSPTVKLTSGEIGVFSFQMLAESHKWLEIRDPQNLYHVNDRWFTPLSEAAYTYTDENGVSVVNVVCPEIESLLSRQYHQAYNCGIYVYCKARFNRFVNGGAEFIISSSGCSNPGNTISTANAWAQVQAWTAKDDDGNQLTYSVLSSDEYKPTRWEDFPSGVFFKSVSVSSTALTVVVESRAKMNTSKVFQYNSSGTYNLNETPVPVSVSAVKVNSTVTTTSYDPDLKINYTTGVKTSEKEITSYNYNSSTGVVTVRYNPAQNETVNAITITYAQNDLGSISAGATCTFAYGAEAVDEHTFVILPKAKTKYYLTIDGAQYNDASVKDARGILMPRGSGGYAMWAALKNTGWTLGICDVIAKDFNASIDYGCFNVESDMKDTLSNIRYIQQLYGGILDWDSENKILNYRAENYDHYQAYKDGFNEWKGYVFREGKNMTARPVITYDNNIITRAYLLGYGNLNVRKVNNGKTYVENFDYTKDVYEGYLKQELIYDTRDEGGMKQLLYWGKKELEKQSRPRRNVKLEVTDLRTVEGLEHEVFDINDVVKVYYHDESTDTDVIEEQRVVLWEYNAFAMWDCTVELGDKTVNEVELFKLIYNKSLTTPGTNGSGNISSGNITVEGGGGDVWNQNSLTNHIELIARTTTDNSDAIAALILDTDAYHAQVDLFAYYQKKTDEMFNQSYAGLQFYADAKSAQAIVEANHYTENYVTGEISSTRAALIEYTDAQVAQVGLVAEGYWKDLDGKITNASAEISATLSKEVSNLTAKINQQWEDTNGAITKAVGGLEVTLTEKYSSLSATVAQQWRDTQGAITTAIGGLRTDISQQYVSTSMFSDFQYQNNQKWINAQSYFDAYAGLDRAVATISANYATKDSIPTRADIQLIATEAMSSVTISALKGSSGAQIYLDSYGYLNCNASTSINFSSAGVINLGMDHGETVYIRGQNVLKMSAKLQTILDGQDGGYIYYFGWKG